MSGGALDYVHSDIRNGVIEKIDPKVNRPHEGSGVDPEHVEWDVEETIEYLNDFAELLYVYEWWQSGDVFEDIYREQEREFIEKWQ